MSRMKWMALAALMVACGGDGAPAADGDASTADAGPADAPIDAPESPLEFPDLEGVSVLEDMNADPNIVEVELVAGYRTLSLGDGLEFEMHAYNGQVPGPALVAAAGDEVIVHFRNDLVQPTTVHWHGLRIPDEMDGTPRVQEPVAPGATFEYRFVVPEAGTFWYHPHVRSHFQMERGLAGPIVIRDRLDPDYDAERVLVLDDILIDPDTGGIAPAFSFHGEAVHGRTGNVLLTNGHVSEEAPSGVATRHQVERWRVVNTANARTMQLSVEGATFRVIGTDGGRLAEPYVTERLLMPVGQRYDLEVTYSSPGRVELISHVPSLDAAGELIELAVPVFGVDVGDDATATAREISWPAAPVEPARPPTRDAEITMNALTDDAGNLNWVLNGLIAPEEPLFTFDHGSTVRLTLRNLAAPEHPFHLHGQFFEIVDQGTPWTSQPGLKDTVLVPGGETVEVIVSMDNPGRWMAHCHILEHAELGMMAEVVVSEPVAAP